MRQPGGVWCVSCRRVLADSWLELSHKTPEPLGAQLENRVTACWDPWLSQGREGKELSLGRACTCWGLGRNPGLCLCQVFYFCCAPESLNPTPVLGDGGWMSLIIPDG